ncbi:MAG TPA: nitric-oxide reductase large subunit, partial [Burkholderiales bacterium]|nr:nitric-oxide reductase large subunit [Burkholderiales bacterium]
MQNNTRRLWIGLALVFFLSFAALGWIGREIYLAAPPVPEAVTTTDGRTLYTGEQIQDGQRAWRAAGGQQLGTVWGHGSYVAPDWSADWLHREALAYRDILSESRYGKHYEALALDRKAAIDAQVRNDMRANTYDAKS